MTRVKIIEWVGFGLATAAIVYAVLIFMGIFTLPEIFPNNSGFNQIFYGLIFLNVGWLLFFIFFVFFEAAARVMAEPLQGRGRMANIILISGLSVTIVLIVIVALTFSGLFPIPYPYVTDPFPNEVLYGLLYFFSALIFFLFTYFLYAKVRNQE